MTMKKLLKTNRFKILKDGWTCDNKFKIGWAPSSEKYMNLESAKKYCADIGGRLPILEELHSLVDYTKREPAINTDIFKGTKSSYYWTSTPVVGCSGAF